MLNIPDTPMPDAPYLFDKVVAELQTELFGKLSWLTHAFGISQILTEVRDQKEYKFPAVYVGSKEYINVLPNQEMGNYSFFALSDPENYTEYKGNFGKLSVNYSLIFWYNVEDIMNGSYYGGNEYIKALILEALTRKIALRSGRISVEKVQTSAANIYAGYSIKEVESQYLIQPYSGLRIEGVLTVNEGCEL